MNKRNFAILSLFLLLIAGGCYKNEPVPTADFSYAGSNEFKVPCTVQFTNQSLQSYSFEWWFGADSSVVTIDPPGSSLKDPVYSYNKPGKFTITLRAYTESRKEWASVKKIITIKDTVR